MTRATTARAGTAARSGKNAVPRELKLLSGTGGRDAGNRLIPPEVPFRQGPMTKPEGLSEDGSWMWDRVVEQMETIGLLKPIDEAALFAACENFAAFREAVRWRQQHGLVNKGSQGLSMAPWLNAQIAAGREFRNWCAEFGMTPAAKKNLVAESGATDGLGENPFG